MKLAQFSILMTIALVASGGQAADAPTVSLATAVQKITADQPTLVIVGEDHKNSSLARSVTQLASALADKQNLNCIFLELPSDSQAQLSAAIDKADLGATALAILEPKLEPTLAAYEKLGAEAGFLETVKKAWFANPIAVLEKFPIDQAFLNLVKRRNISVIPFDSSSNAPETIESLYFSIARQREPNAPELVTGAVNSFDTRSKIMSENIRASMKAQSCTSALVVVGYAHLYDSSAINEPLGTNFSLSPLQVLLDQEGLDSKVLIADESRTDGATREPAITFGTDDRFANFTGYLLSPP